MKAALILSDFLFKAAKDPRIGISHIGLFAAVVVLWHRQGAKGPVIIFARQMMAFCRISSTATYHKLMHQLSAYGYLKFEVSFKNNCGSRIDLPDVSA